MRKLNAITLIPLIALAAVATAGERLPDERAHEANVTRERVPDGFRPMDDRELSRTRGVVNAPELLAAPTANDEPRQYDNEMVRQQQLDEATLTLDLDTRIQDTARALQGAPDALRPGLEQRYQNLTTLREGF